MKERGKVLGGGVRKAYASKGDDTTLSRFVKVPGERTNYNKPKQGWLAGTRFDVSTSGRSIFYKRGVKAPDAKPLVSGHSNVKIGRDVRKGKLFRGYWIFTLTSRRLPASRLARTVRTSMRSGCARAIAWLSGSSVVIFFLRTRWAGSTGTAAGMVGAGIRGTNTRSAGGCASSKGGGSTCAIRLTRKVMGLPASSRACSTGPFFPQRCCSDEHS